MRERGTQARTGSEYGAGTRGTGSQCEARGLMAPPHHSALPHFSFYISRGRLGTRQVVSHYLGPKYIKLSVRVVDVQLIL